MSKVIKGLSASTGIVIGSAWVYHPVEIIINRIENANPVLEWERLQNALIQTKDQLKFLETKARDQVGEAEAEIFSTHLMFLEDPELLAVIKRKIDSNLNVEASVQEGFEGFANTLIALDDEYFQARAADILDVGRRIVACLSDINLGSVNLPKEPVVIFAEDLAPSDTMLLEKNLILGFCTKRGGPTAHTAILARSLGVPAVVSAPFDMGLIETGQLVVLNGESGELIIEPTEHQLEEAVKKRDQVTEIWTNQLKKADQDAVTTDGHEVEVVANIGSLADAIQAIEYGAEGVGLLRTEFLYLDRDHLPELEDQVNIYQQIFEVMDNRPVVVRTLDIGGDKAVSYLGLKSEPNPFLGWRAIRMIGERPEILRDQFQALLRAGVNTDLRIMLPFVSSVDEVIAAKEIFSEAQQILIQQKKPFAKRVQFGIMIEIPSAALLVEKFAEHVDFYSIGTNDLAQYTLAVDRTNERVATLASPFHPAVIQLIALTIEKAHNCGKWVGLCGEMAGDPLALPLLLGLNLDEFSMAPISVPGIKEKIRKSDKKACKKIAEHVLGLSKTNDIITYLQNI